VCFVQNQSVYGKQFIKINEYKSNKKGVDSKLIVCVTATSLNCSHSGAAIPFLYKDISEYVMLSWTVLSNLWQCMILLGMT